MESSEPSASVSVGDRSEQSVKPQIQLKVEVFHDVQNQDRFTPDVEKQVKNLLNVHDERVADIRISVGYKASAVFLTLQQKLWGSERVERVVTALPRWLERADYADDIRVTNWFIEAVRYPQEEDDG